MHHYLQIDLDDFFLGRRSWATFVELVQMLPQGSAYWAAVADDEELAAQVIDDLKPNPRPPLHGWTQAQETLTTLVDYLDALLIAVARQDRAFEPSPRPEKAIDRITAKRLKDKGDSLLRKLLGDRQDL